MQSCISYRVERRVLAVIVCLLILCGNQKVYGDIEKTRRTKISKVVKNKNTRAYRYVLNLESTFTKNTDPWLPTLSSLKRYALYTMPYKHKGKLWFRLRLGFFSSRSNANRALKTLKPYYPGVWVDRISSDEFSRMKRWEKIRLKDVPDEIESLPVKPIQKSGTETKKSKIKTKRNSTKLMELAKRALAKKRYREAAQYYMRIIASKDDKHKKEAQEFLGLAREKKGQLAHAKAEYRKYLKLYPEGEGAERVKQRLLALVTARNTPRARRKDKSKEDVYWSSFGSFSQFFRHDVSDADGITIENQSLESDLVVSARRRSGKYDIKTFMSGSHLYDIDDDSRNKEKLSSLYAELTERQGSYMARVGRFTRNSDGVFGRMDGVWGDYGISEKLKLNLVAGYPVELTSTNRSIKDKPFYSLGLYGGTYKNSWDYNVYYFNRDVESMTDRQSLGGELRYIGGKQTAFALLDYDMYFSKLNSLFAVSNWRLPKNSLVNLTLNYRMSPLLMTTSALQGQGTTSIDTLRQTYSEEQIKQFALDRTTVYRSLTLSGNRELSKKYSLNGEVTVSNLSGTQTSAGVDATPSTGNEFFYGVQIIGLNLYSSLDTSVGELRYEDTSNYKKYKLSASTRWRTKNKWSYRPKLSYDIRDNNDGSELTKIVPSVRIDYRHTKKVKFELDMQYEDIVRKSNISGKENNYSISIGYIYDFL